MARTILQEFEGEPELTPEKIANIKDWYAGLQGDADKADSIDDANYYQGGVDMAVSILALLYGYERIPNTDEFKKSGT